MLNHDCQSPAFFPRPSLLSWHYCGNNTKNDCEGVWMPHVNLITWQNRPLSFLFQSIRQKQLLSLIDNIPFVIVKLSFCNFCTNLCCCVSMLLEWMTMTHTFMCLCQPFFRLILGSMFCVEEKWTVFFSCLQWQEKRRDNEEVLQNKKKTKGSFQSSSGTTFSNMNLEASRDDWWCLTLFFKSTVRQKKTRRMMTMMEHLSKRSSSCILSPVMTSCHRLRNHHHHHLCPCQDDFTRKQTTDDKILSTILLQQHKYLVFDFESLQYSILSLAETSYR